MGLNAQIIITKEIIISWKIISSSSSRRTIISITSSIFILQLQQQKIVRICEDFLVITEEGLCGVLGGRTAEAREEEEYQLRLHRIDRLHQPATQTQLN